MAYEMSGVEAATGAAAAELQVARRLHTRVDRLLILFLLLAFARRVLVEAPLNERVRYKLEPIVDEEHLESAEDEFDSGWHVGGDDDVRECALPAVLVAALRVHKAVLDPLEHPVHLHLRRLGRLATRQVEKEDWLRAEEG